jgi:hypothetical protein
MSNAVIWVHGDNLSPQSTAFVEFPHAPAIFVWDDPLLEQWQISLKRIVFIYECVLELPCVILRGDVAEQVIAFAHEHSAQRIVTMDSPSPRFRAIVKRLEARLPVSVLHEVAFVDYNGTVDIGRFSRYWRVASRYAYDHSGTTIEDDDNPS